MPQHYTKDISFKRDTSIDNLSGLFILYMILSHTLQLCDLGYSMLYKVTTRIFFCFMGFFFWKSGRFYKERKCIPLINKLSKDLLRPYAKWVVISLILEVCYALNHSEQPVQFFKTFILYFLKEEAPGSNAALWFLPTLFASKLIFSIAHKKVNGIIILTVSFVLAFAINATGIKEPVWAGNIPYALTFYSFGYISKNWKGKRLTIIVIAIMIVYAIFPNYVGARDDVLVYGNCFPLAILSSMAFIWAFYIVFSKFNLNIKPLSLVGKKSLILYISHYVFLFYFTQFLIHNGISGTLTAIIASACLIPYFYIIIKINKKISLC